MDRYTARINLHGSNTIERYSNQLKEDISRKSPSNPSYKSVKLNDIDTQLIINSGTETYYKEFQSLPGQKILTGDYIEWANQIWLVYSADPDDDIYIDGELRQCQYKLYWQKDNGAIISRYAWVQNASAYNNGEQGNSNIILQSNQFMVYMPYDEDTALLDNGVRINMSKGVLKCKPYKLTRPDDISYGYGEKGLINIIFTQTQYDATKDKHITLPDGNQVWICDYHSPTDVPEPKPDPGGETPVLSASISGGNTLRCGRSKTWSVTFKDKNGNEVTDCDFKWNVVSEFDITQTINANKIQLRVDNEDCINSSFLLQVIHSVNPEVLANAEITIIEGF